ncbi:MAG TPA: alpha/beta hydrolase [Bacteroidales bacterium]|jgi:pimeloyl-ACP methyl ester carboxylesterase|nr:alpha/beta hydrolase [Bacteroidales bacterium]
MKTINKTLCLRIITGGIIFLSALCLTALTIQAQTSLPRFVFSKDNTPISYEVYGSGEPTLVFVHGWSCDSRYWRNQIDEFSESNRIVLIDLAGHGHSGTTRDVYSMKAFGEDVKAVVEATGSKKVILIGHSMGGPVNTQAAKLMPERVKGLIGIDTYSNVEYPLTQEEADGWIAPLRQDYQTGARQFVRGMIYPYSDTLISTWIMADMAAAPSAIALSAMEELMALSINGEAATIFENLPIPVMAVHGDMWPIDFEGNRRHMHSFDAIVIKEADHFLMLNKPEEFNKALRQAIEEILKIAKKEE